MMLFEVDYSVKKSRRSKRENVNESEKLVRKNNNDSLCRSGGSRDAKMMQSEVKR
jgi:hypothetical protein